MINKNFFLNVIWSMGSHILSRGVLLLSGMLLARNLSVEDFAMYNFFLMTSMTIMNYSSMGLEVASSRFFAEKKENQNHILLGNLYSLATILALCSAVITFIFIDRIWDISVFYKSLMTITVFFLVINIVPTGGVMGVEKYKDLFFLSIFNAVIIFSGVFLTIALENISIQIYAYILSVIFSILIQTYILKKNTDLFSSFSHFKLNKKAIKEIMSFGGIMSIVSIFAATAPWLLGKIILDRFNELYFSIYSIGLQWFALAMFIPGMISRVILPRLVKEYKKDKTSKKEVRTTLLFTLVVAFILFIFGSLLSPYLIQWYGNEYMPFSNIISFFFLIAIAYAPINVLANIIIVKLNTKIWFFITLAWFICLLILLLPMINLYGFWGVLYAQGISALLYNILALITCIRHGYI
ncbi:oligosaccharide flippase family protein [Pasteurella sp. PK-2025]|uniref:oligosaccharide flippase family protein n=1 Tax=Pasteurella sp. PK-2025 TaxID=3413133 RepID=UPI003C73220F